MIMAFLGVSGEFGPSCMECFDGKCAHGVLNACMHGKRAYGNYVYARPLHSAGVFWFSVDMRPMGLVILNELSILCRALIDALRWACAHDREHAL